MSDIITETSGGVLRVELNRPARRNAMTSGMDVGLAEILGDDFSAGDDIGDFLSNPPSLGEPQQAQLTKAFISLQADHGARSGRRHRRRDHDADAPRFRLRRREREGSDAVRLATRVVPHRDLLATAAGTAQKQAEKLSGAVRVSKRLIKQASLGPLREASATENRALAAWDRCAEAKEALSTS